MNKYIYLLVIVTTLFACSDSEKKEVKIIAEENNSTSQIVEEIEKKKLPDSMNKQRIANITNNFTTFYKKFTTAIINKKGNEVNECIYPNFGLYVIESKGAMPTITQFYRFSNFDHKESVRLAFESLDSASFGLPRMEPLPKVICDTEAYDKQGCFAQEINPLQASRIWNYANLNEKEIQAIEFLAETVNITVVNTSNFTYYFSKIKESWYLTFIDLRVPCSV